MNTTTDSNHRRLDTFMAFWDAINEARANAGLPEALYANMRQLWDQAMAPTKQEVNCAVERRMIAARCTARDMQAGGPFPIAIECDPNRDERGNWIGSVSNENGWTA